jgi:hypothetical protein
MASSFKYQPEVPNTHALDWQRMKELDLEIHNTASLVTALVQNYNLPGRAVDEPLVQGFLTVNEEEFEGIFLDLVNNGKSDLKVVMRIGQSARGGTVRDAPALAVAAPALSERDIEAYDLASLYRMYITYGVYPGVLFGLTQGLVTRLADQLITKQGTMVPELVKMSALFHAVNLKSLSS